MEYAPGIVTMNNVGGELSLRKLAKDVDKLLYYVTPPLSGIDIETSSTKGTEDQNSTKTFKSDTEWAPIIEDYISKWDAEKCSDWLAKIGFPQYRVIQVVPIYVFARHAYVCMCVGRGVIFCSCRFPPFIYYCLYYIYANFYIICVRNLGMFCCQFYKW